MYLYYSKFSRLILCICVSAYIGVVSYATLSRVPFIAILIALDNEKAPKVEVSLPILCKSDINGKEKELYDHTDYPLFVLLICDLSGVDTRRALIRDSEEVFE